MAAELNKRDKTFAYGFGVLAMIFFGIIFVSSTSLKKAEEAQKYELDRLSAEAKLERAKKGIPEYRPILVSNRTIVLGTAYQCSVDRTTLVILSGAVACTSTLTGGGAGSLSIQISPTSGGTYAAIPSSAQNTNSVSLAIAITVSQTNGSAIIGAVPAGYYFKVVSTTTTGTPTFSISTTDQEINL